MTSAGGRLGVLLAEYPVVLTEGAVLERLRRDGVSRLDPWVAHARLAGNPSGRQALAAIYREYLHAASGCNLPIWLSAPTWRAGSERCDLAGVDLKRLNRDALELLFALRDEFPALAPRVVVGGLLGCRGDAYRPEQTLSADTSFRHHSPQAVALATAGAEVLLAATLPALPEASGLARAMADTGTPCVLSFIIRPTGTLLDGTPLDRAIRTIDGQTRPEPLGYLVNCVHADVLDSALASLPAGDWRRRLLGLQANTADLSPEELDGASDLHSEPPSQFAQRLITLHHRYGLRVLGGCCGTDQRHIQALAELLRPPHGPCRGTS